MRRMKVNYDEIWAREDIENELIQIFEEVTEEYTGVTIINIGTDRNIPDSVGPMTGTFLSNKELPDYVQVIGTLKTPAHALNLDKRLMEIKESNLVIAIDACLGNSEDIGQIQVRDYPVSPGKGVGKSLPKVGDYSIIAIVGSHEDDSIFSGNSTRINFIWEMSNLIADCVAKALKEFKPKMAEESIEQAI